jgi:signal transduction histidine kinase
MYTMEELLATDPGTDTGILPVTLEAIVDSIQEGVLPSGLVEDGIEDGLHLLPLFQQITDYDHTALAAEVSGQYVRGLVDWHENWLMDNEGKSDFDGKANFLDRVLPRYFVDQDLDLVKERVQRGMIPLLLYHTFLEEMLNEMDVNRTEGAVRCGAFGVASNPLLVGASAVLPTSWVVQAVGYFNKHMNHVTEMEYVGRRGENGKFVVYGLTRTQDEGVTERMREKLTSSTNNGADYIERVLTAMYNRDLATTFGAFFGVGYLAGDHLKGTGMYQGQGIGLKLKRSRKGWLKRKLAAVGQVFEAFELGLYNLVGFFGESRRQHIDEVMEKADYGLLAVNREVVGAAKVRAKEAEADAAAARAALADARAENLQERLTALMDLTENARDFYAYLHHTANALTAGITRERERYNDLGLDPAAGEIRQTPAFLEYLMGVIGDGEKPTDVREAAERYYEIISDQHTRLSQANYLLEHGQLSGTLETIFVYGQLVDPVVRTVRGKVSGVELTYVTGDDDMQVQCLADKTRLAVGKLVKNAAEASVGGGVEITVEQHENGYLLETEICIYQSGGMSSEFADKVNGGVRVETTKEHGHAIGLVEAIRLLEQTKGAVYMESLGVDGGKTYVTLQSDTRKM